MSTCSLQIIQPYNLTFFPIYRASEISETYSSAVFPYQVICFSFSKPFFFLFWYIGLANSDIWKVSSQFCWYVVVKHIYNPYRIHNYWRRQWRKWVDLQSFSACCLVRCCTLPLVWIMVNLGIVEFQYTRFIWWLCHLMQWTGLGEYCEVASLLCVISLNLLP